MDSLIERLRCLVIEGTEIHPRLVLPIFGVRALLKSNEEEFVGVHIETMTAEGHASEQRDSENLNLVQAVRSFRVVAEFVFGHGKDPYIQAAKFSNWLYTADGKGALEALHIGFHNSEQINDRSTYEFGKFDDAAPRAGLLIEFTIDVGSIWIDSGKVQTVNVEGRGY